MTKKVGRIAELRYNHHHDDKGRFCSDPNNLYKRYSNGGAKPIDKSENSGIMKSSDDLSYISATGPNEFEKGFSYSNLVAHWYGDEKTHSHKYEYPKLTMQQYAERALNLIQSPTSSNILGYKTKEGCVVRYDVLENDYVKGNPKTGIKTMFKPKRKQDYYEDRKSEEGIE